MHASHCVEMSQHYKLTVVSRNAALVEIMECSQLPDISLKYQCTFLTKLDRMAGLTLDSEGSCSLVKLWQLHKHLCQ